MSKITLVVMTLVLLFGIALGSGGLLLGQRSGIIASGPILPSPTLFPTPPPPPPPPSPPVIPPPPTPDTTPVFTPGPTFTPQPTLSPREIREVMPNFWVGLGPPLSPTAKWQRFRDPTFGFSVEYPSNWYIRPDISTQLATPFVALQVRNYAFEGMWRSQKPPEYSRISVFRGIGALKGYRSLEDYLERTLAGRGDTRVLSEEHITVAGRPAIQQVRLLTGDGEREDIIVTVLLVRGIDVYSITDGPPDSPYFWVWERMVGSFRLEELE